jgi:hypothetical protein
MAAKKDKDRDGKGFLALPTVVLDSAGWRQASHTARSLLIDIGRQYTGSNNGKLLATLDVLSSRGWRSPGVLVQARQELVACGLLIETRKGGFPNLAAWYALPWVGLHQKIGLDINARMYDTQYRGAYMRPQPYSRPTRKSAASPDTPRVPAERPTRTRRVTGQPPPDTPRVTVEA